MLNSLLFLFDGQSVVYLHNILLNILTRTTSTPVLAVAYVYLLPMWSVNHICSALLLFFLY